MPHRVHWVATCDRCGKTQTEILRSDDPAGTSREVALQRFEALGWAADEDLCPECAQHQLAREIWRAVAGGESLQHCADRLGAPWDRARLRGLLLDQFGELPAA